MDIATLYNDYIYKNKLKYAMKLLKVEQVDTNEYGLTLQYKPDSFFPVIGWCNFKILALSITETGQLHVLIKVLSEVMNNENK